MLTRYWAEQQRCRSMTEAGIIVTAYADRAEGVMEVRRDGVGRFKSVVLRPTVTLATGSDVGLARTLHKPTHEKCYVVLAEG
jgi:organic hydroperoxide reductase OsmC/OhrA